MVSNVIVESFIGNQYARANQRQSSVFKFLNSYFGKTCEDGNRFLDIILDQLDNVVFYVFVEMEKIKIQEVARISGLNKWYDFFNTLIYFSFLATIGIFSKLQNTRRVNIN